jgi:hypothetical protein
VVGGKVKKKDGGRDFGLRVGLRGWLGWVIEWV